MVALASSAPLTYGEVHSLVCVICTFEHIQPLTWQCGFVALLYSAGTGHPAFSGVATAVFPAAAPGVPVALLNPLAAKALGAAVFTVLFGLRAYWVYWSGAVQVGAPSRGMTGKGAKKAKIQ